LISIVVPTFDRPEALPRCLDGIAAMAGAGPDLEVVVVNDGGEPPSRAVIERLRGRLDVRVIDQRRAGPAAARNAGAERARGTVVAFLDDDCVPQQGWLAALAVRCAAEPDAAIGGRTINALPENPYSTASQLVVDHLYAHHNADGRAATFLASNNVAFPRRELLEIGSFDARFPRPAGEDRDLCDRWHRLGRRMVFAPEAVVRHAHVLGMGTFWRQHFDYGRGAFSFRRARAQREGTRIALERPRFYADLLRAPFATHGGARGAGLALLLVVSQVASTAGYARERTQLALRGE